MILDNEQIWFDHRKYGMINTKTIKERLLYVRQQEKSDFKFSSPAVRIIAGE